MATFNVTDAASFNSAISSAVGGDQINMAPGSYGDISINRNFSSTVTITSTTTHAAEIRQLRMSSGGSSNIRFEDVYFYKPWFAGQPDLDDLLKLTNCSDIWFENCIIRGGVVADGGSSDGKFHGRGLNGTGNTDCTWNNCVFRDFLKAIGGSQNTRYDFLGVEVYNMSSDGVTMSDFDFVTFRGCYFHDWKRIAGDGTHADMIQTDRSNGVGARNLTIEECVFDHARGGFGQGLWAGGDGQADNATSRHQNFVYRNNILYVDSVNTMRTFWVDGAIMEKNTLIRVDAGNTAGTESVIGVYNGTNVTCTDNMMGALDAAGGNNTNNVVILVANHAAEFNILADASNGPDLYNDYEIKAGSPAHTAMAGSRMMKREGGWGGQEITPHPAYLGGNSGSTPPPTLQTLPSGSVSATVTVP